MMKTFYFTAIIVCGQIFQPCNAMEQKAQHPILQIIKDIEEPSCGHFIDPETVIISHKKGVTTHHLPTNTELKKISNVPSQHLALHPNKKLCAWFGEDKLRIYDTEIGPQYEIESIPVTASIFDPLNEDIIVLLDHHDNPPNFRIIRLNYKTGYWIDKALPRSVIAFHPTAKIMYRADRRGILSIHDSNCLQVIDNHMAARQTHSRHTFCQLSPDGSLLMEGDEQIFRIRDNKKDALRPGSMKNANIHEIIFHPNGQFLITLSQSDNTISYWDLINTPPNPTISMSCSSSEDNPPTAHKHMHTYLSCDPLGEKLLVILSRQCLIVPMPFEVIYHPQAEEECIFAYFALQHELPKDVRQVLIRKLLTLCKR